MCTYECPKILNSYRCHRGLKFGTVVGLMVSIHRKFNSCNCLLLTFLGGRILPLKHIFGTSWSKFTNFAHLTFKQVDIYMRFRKNKTNLNNFSISAWSFTHSHSEMLWNNGYCHCHLRSSKTTSFSFPPLQIGISVLFNEILHIRCGEMVKNKGMHEISKNSSILFSQPL